MLVHRRIRRVDDGIQILREIEDEESYDTGQEAVRQVETTRVGYAVCGHQVDAQSACRCGWCGRLVCSACARTCGHSGTLVCASCCRVRALGVTTNVWLYCFSCSVRRRVEGLLAGG